jgi:hypothetical protein
MKLMNFIRAGPGVLPDNVLEEGLSQVGVIKAILTL